MLESDKKGAMRLRTKLSWWHLRPYFYTMATTLSYHNVWRLPRAAYHFGPGIVAVATTVAMLVVGLPTALLQLAMGQLSQRDPVGVWTVVPFFKGVGYLRMAISFLCSTYNVVYLALSFSFFLYTLGRSIPFHECYLYDRVSFHSTNATICLKTTFLAPISKKPEYYIALTLIIIVTWAKVPLMLYSPVKFTKRVFFVLAPLALVSGLMVQIGAGDYESLSWFRWGDWTHFLEPYIWQGAVTQSFLATHSAGGFLVAASEPIYRNKDLKKTAAFIVLSNVAMTWLVLLFWYSVGCQPPSDSPVAVLTQIYDAAVEKNLYVLWPLMVYAMLILTGIITVMSLLFPMYEWCRRSGGPRWRQLCAAVSVAGVAGSQAAAAGALPALHALDDLVAPFFISVTTAAEISIFFFVYGRKYIVEDIEFLTGRRFNSFWSYSFCVVPVVVIPVWFWWVIESCLSVDAWLSSTHRRFTLTICFVVVLAIIVVSALVAVTRQDQYEKKRLKSSLRPSRDPVTNYYWRERKREVEDGGGAIQADHPPPPAHIYDDVQESPPVYPSLSPPGPLYESIRESIHETSARYKSCCNSYDWVFTGNKRQSAEEQRHISKKKMRRATSCELSSQMRGRASRTVHEALGWGRKGSQCSRSSDDMLRRNSSIVRLTETLQKMHSIPPARSFRRKSVL